MEGNEALDTNVKYGGNKRIQHRPFVVTMNGSSKMDVAGDFPEEFEAINNRCKIFQMMTPLEDVIPPHIINFICKRKKEACKFLIDYSNDNYDQLNKSTDNDLVDKYISRKLLWFWFFNFISMYKRFPNKHSLGRTIFIYKFPSYTIHHFDFFEHRCTII